MITARERLETAVRYLEGAQALNVAGPAYPFTGPGLYEHFRFSLRRLYDMRLSVDYHAESMDSQAADWA